MVRIRLASYFQGTLHATTGSGSLVPLIEMFDPIEIQFYPQGDNLVNIACDSTQDTLTIEADDQAAHYTFKLYALREFSFLQPATGLIRGAG
jgi:hypothetical protein